MMEDRAQFKADFCIATGVQPSEYERLTIVERNAFIATLKKQSRGR